MGIKPFLLALFSLLFLSIVSCSSQNFDFFYFVQQWPPSYCDSRHSCCYPTTGRPAEDFTIHGLWPNYDSGSWPQNCRREDELDKTKISDLLVRMQFDWPTLACPSANGMRFWDHEWERHGTCSSLDQHTYFKAALDLRNKADLLHVLRNAGIRPGNMYALEHVKQAILEGIGYEPFIECNVDSQGNHQLYQVYLCVDVSAENFVHCPVLPHGRACGSSIEFQAFETDTNDEL